MNETLSKIRRNLSRPLPELLDYLRGKLISMAWRPYLDAVGVGFYVSTGTKIQGGRSISIGEHFFGGPFLWIEAVQTYMGHRYSPRISIGSGVTCSHFVHIAATHSISIGNGVLIGSKVHITDHAHGTYWGSFQDTADSPPSARRLSDGRSVVIGDNVWLGDSVVVLPGVVIGKGSVVGANSVVTKSLPPHVMAVGSPAVVIKRFDSDTSTWVSSGPATGCKS